MGKTKEGKEQSVITKITLNDATFHGDVEEPTFINFHFGRNGVGKTTATKVLRHWAHLDKDGDPFPAGCKSKVEPESLDTSKYTMLVYDQDYIDRSFRKVKPGEFAEANYLKAVYTSKGKKKARANSGSANNDNNEAVPDDATFIATEPNVSIDDQIIEKKQERGSIENGIAAANDKIEELKKAEEKFALKIATDIWDNTESIRTNFPESQEGFKRKGEKTLKKFLNKIKDTAIPKNSNVYNEYMLPGLMKLHDTIYSKDETKKLNSYQPIREPRDMFHYKDILGAEILIEEIKGKEDSLLTDLINDLKNSAWVRQGIQYAYDEKNKECKCPFCQQKLPENFREHLNTYFDDTYEKKLDALQSFRNAYYNETDRVYRELGIVLTNPYPGIKDSGLEQLISNLKLAIDANVRQIDDKIEDPTIKVELQYDLASPLKDIHGIITSLNQQIEENQRMIDNLSKEQKRVNDSVWIYLAIVNKGTIDNYKHAIKKYEDDITYQQKIIEKNTPKLSRIDNEIAKIREKGVDITDALNNINSLLTQSGFQGFRLALAPKKNPTDPATAYRVVRETVDEFGNKKVIPAVNLSEGERNFIAFLYFYYTVVGSIDVAGVDKAKIVVIDDPVSSMDGNAVFIVGSLIRNMIEVCHNHFSPLDNIVTGNYIHQIFIFTHNVYFHREVTIKQNDDKRKDHIAFFLYRKIDNKSTVKLCVRKKEDQSGTELENYNPVQNSYATLWTELNELENPISVLNVIRQILDYYFIQLCGYDGAKLDTLILADHFDDFVKKDAEGNVIDRNDYILAQTMIRYLHVYPSTIDDGQYYTEDEMDTKELKSVFKQIFYSLKQDAHYDMMMRAIKMNTDMEKKDAKKSAREFVGEALST